MLHTRTCCCPSPFALILPLLGLGLEGLSPPPRTAARADAAARGKAEAAVTACNTRASRRRRSRLWLWDCDGAAAAISVEASERGMCRVVSCRRVGAVIGESDLRAMADGWMDARRACRNGKARESVIDSTGRSIDSSVLSCLVLRSDSSTAQKRLQASLCG
jgi:hypothetical protein